MFAQINRVTWGLPAVNVFEKQFYTQSLLLQEEIKRLKAELSSKTKSIDVREKEEKANKDYNQQLIREKTSTIEALTLRLHESEMKINQFMRDSLTGSSNAAIKRLQDDIDKLKADAGKKDEEMFKLTMSLEESQTKYSTFKKKVKMYQEHCKRNEERYKDLLRTRDDDFRAKLANLTEKMKHAYDTKLNEVRYCDKLVFT